LTRHLGSSAVALIMLVASAPALERSLENNRWSLRVERAALSRGLGDIAQLSPPENHPRGGVWQGLMALAEARPGIAVSVIEESLHESPDDIMLHSLLAKAYEAEGRPREARSEWERANAWEEMIRAASRALAARRYDDAWLFLQAAQGRRPLQVVRYQTSVLFAQGKVDEAISLLRESIQSWPSADDRQEWLILLGEGMGRMAQWADAIAAYRKALTVENGTSAWKAHIGLGMALYASGKQSEVAEAEVQQGIDLMPGESDGYVAMGDILRSDNRYAEADDWYRAAVEKDPENVWIGVRRVDNLVEGQQPEQAQRILSELIQRFPDEAHLYYELGQAYGRQGKLDLAVAAAEKSVSLDRSGNSEYRVALATMYERLGQMPDAMRAYLQALDLDPGNQSALGGVARLNGMP